MATKTDTYESRKQQAKTQIGEYSKAAKILEDLPFGEITSWEELLAYQTMSTFSYHFSIQSKNGDCIYGIPNEQKPLYLQQAQKYAKVVTDFFFEQRECKPDWFKQGLKGSSAETLQKVWNNFRQAFDIMARKGSFDCFLVALEWNKRPERVFYLPRRKVFMKHNIIQTLQKLYDGKLNKVGISMPPRTGKTGLAKLFILFKALKDLNDEIFAVSYGDKVIKKFYRDILGFFNNPKEYRLNEIYPEAVIFYQNAEDNYIDILEKHEYPTFAFGSLYGANTGTVEARGLFYADDLVKDFMEANNPATLSNTWNQFISTADDRVLDGCPYLIIGTMWGVDCPLSRFYDLYKDDPNSVFLRISCYDENGESNFLYENAGAKKISFSKAYWKDKQQKNDPVIFAAKYLAKPIHKEGRIFDKLQFYTSLPDRKPDRIVGAGDVAVKVGGDRFSFPIAYVYDDTKEVYFPDVCYSNKGTDYTIPRIVNKILEHKIEMAEFEEKEGSRKDSEIEYGIENRIKTMLEKRGYRCDSSNHNASGKQSKTTRVAIYRTEIIGQPFEDRYVFYFKDKTLRDTMSPDDVEYNNFIFDLRNYVNLDIDQIDDAPDSLAILAQYCVYRKRHNVEILSMKEILPY